MARRPTYDPPPPHAAPPGAGVHRAGGGRPVPVRPRGKPSSRGAVEQADTEAGEGVILIGDDFDYTFTERERPIFRIRGDSIRADREDTLFLDKVGVTFYDENHQPYHVESKEASFNRANNEGRLQGNVLPPGAVEPGAADGAAPDPRERQAAFHAEARRAALRRAYIVTGNRMRVELEDEVFVLNGDARINSVPGTEPAAGGSSERAIYERQHRVLRIEGKAKLRRGPQRIQAQRITGFLTPDESGLTFVRALWNVSGQTRPAAPGPGSRREHPRDVQGQGPGGDLAARGQPGPEGRAGRNGGPSRGPGDQRRGGRADPDRAAVRRDPRRGGPLAGRGAQRRGPRRDDARPSKSGQREVRRASGKRAEAVFRPDGQLADMRLLARRHVRGSPGQGQGQPRQPRSGRAARRALRPARGGREREGEPRRRRGWCTTPRTRS